MLKGKKERKGEYLFIDELKKKIRRKITREITTKELKEFLKKEYGLSELYIAIAIYPVLRKRGFYFKGGGANWVIGLEDEKK